AMVAQRATDLLALGRDRPPAALALCEGGATAEACEVEVRSLEQRDGRRRRWCNEDVADAVPLLSSWHGLPLLGYALDARACATARATGLRARGGDPRLK